MTTPGISCGRVRRLLWPDGGPRATSPDLIAAQEHLAACDACQRFVQEMRAQADVLRTAALREAAPADVRRRLFTVVARARAGVQPAGRRVVPLSWLVAAVATLAILGGALAVDHLWRHGSVDSIAALVDDHARALGDARIASSDQAMVSRWLAERVHFAMFVPALPNARLLGARLRIEDGRRGVAVQYSVNGVPVTYFVTPDGSDGLPPQGAVGAMQFQRLMRAGYHVVAWREPGLLHAMVGNISESQLASLAEACIKQARGTVAARGSHSQPYKET